MKKHKAESTPSRKPCSNSSKSPWWGSLSPIEHRVAIAPPSPSTPHSMHNKYSLAHVSPSSHANWHFNPTPKFISPNSTRFLPPSSIDKSNTISHSLSPSISSSITPSPSHHVTHMADSKGLFSFVRQHAQRVKDHLDQQSSRRMLEFNDDLLPPQHFSPDIATLDTLDIVSPTKTPPPQQSHHESSSNRAKNKRKTVENAISQSGALLPSPSYESPSKTSGAAEVKKKCHCKKSRCLKLYCECFARGELCHGCNCVGCYNTVGYETERREAIQTTLERDQNAFRPKVNENQGLAKHIKGCHCKKSSCLKKYCECFQAGVPCSTACKCIDCKNNEPHDRPQKNKIKPKAQISIK